MQFLALIYSQDDNQDVDMTTLVQQYEAFAAEAGAAGVLEGGNALQPVTTATSVKVRDKKLQFTDGPFAETKEQLGGYFMLNCESLDEALTWAAKIPTARYGTVEVRPVMVYE